MLTAEYRELLVALAGAAAALTGLLFVALSLAPRSTPVLANATARQVRSGAALIAFTNVLVVSLFGLVPGTGVRYQALAMGVIGLLFTAAGVRSLWTGLPSARQRLRQLGLVVLLLLIFGVELVCGLIMVTGRPDGEPLLLIGYALVASVLVGVARSWEIVAGRDTGLTASLTTLLGHSRPPADAPDVAEP